MGVDHYSVAPLEGGAGVVLLEHPTAAPPQAGGGDAYCRACISAGGEGLTLQELTGNWKSCLVTSKCWLGTGKN